MTSGSGWLLPSLAAAQSLTASTRALAAVTSPVNEWLAHRGASLVSGFFMRSPGPLSRNRSSLEWNYLGKERWAAPPPQHDDSSPRVLRPARHRHGGPAERRVLTGSPAVVTVWLDSPYQRFRWGCQCPSGSLTAQGARSVHGRCATAARRGTDLLAGRRRARRGKAGVRTPVSGSVRAAGSGPGGHLVAGRRRRRTRQHGPWSRAGVVALRAPARPAPRPAGELSQQSPA